ncbi:GTPase IMAP family member 7-like [Clinocottus analis]|uniref:GTPase IMAP family member 7-like n=1 Tax=Clinocottus analis TaxID=304258 RepID=UPI0035C106E6
MDVSTRRIVILGKTGAGKSSLANTIFGEQLFKIGHTVNSDTSKCQAETKSINGRNITLIDTPDLSQEEQKSEIVRCITELSPGPHAFLFVIKVARYTEQEQALVTNIRQNFSEEVLKYATVLFTHGDQLDEKQTIEDYVCDNELLKDLVKKCGGRCHVIDNKYWKNNQQDEYRSNQFQVKQLLKTIDEMVETNGGRCYTNEALRAVEERIKQEMQFIRQSHENMSEEEIRELARCRVSERPWLSLAGITTGVWEGALFGVEIMVRVVVSVFDAGIGLARSAADVAAGTRVAAGSALTAGVEAVTGCFGAQGADTHLEAAETGRH